MAVAQVALFEPGTVVSTFKSRGFLKGSDVTKRTVVGNERGGFIPVGIIENGNDQYYKPVSLTILDEAAHTKGATVEKKSEPSTEEMNITKLWNCTALWDETNSQALKEGTVVWATFDNNEKITELSLIQPEDKSSGFRFGDNGSIPDGEIKFPPLKLQVKEGHLYPIMNYRVPSTIHYQLEVFNWLVSTISPNRKATKVE
jgi:hypothetical protein